MIEMIALDLDNTLLRTDKTISAYTADVLRRCRQKGILVAYSTARPPRTIARFALDIKPDAVVCHSGAIVRDAHGGESYAAIPFDTALRIARELAAKNPKATISLELGDKLYANFDMSGIRGCEDYIFTDFTGLPEDAVYKMIVGVGSRDDAERIAAMLPPELYALPCEDTLALIMNRAATKLGGVRRVAQASGIPMERVAAFGDDVSDIESLIGCGIGVAMANAIPAVKAVADCICGSNDEDGVAHWLEENLLTQEEGL
jgi:Cof subfamily protein (haloacid dehalogenase superfamily)